jgi:hypothetical protein
MGSTWFTDGVSAKPHERIQFDFVFEGVRYRPSIRRPPSESNLRRARERLRAIETQIEVSHCLTKNVTQWSRCLTRNVTGEGACHHDAPNNREAL